MVFYYELIDNADQSIHAPTKKHIEDAGWDLPAYLPNGPHIIPARGSTAIPTAIKTHFPDGYVAMIKSRSGLSVKNNIEHGAGICDSNFKSNIIVKLYNHGDQEFIVEDGMRIAQLLFIPIYAGPIMNFNEKNNLERGEKGFGSSGI